MRDSAEVEDGRMEVVEFPPEEGDSRLVKREEGEIGMECEKKN